MKQRKFTVAALAAALVGGMAFIGSATAATITESESNDTFANADAVSAGLHTLVGSINPAQDVDIWEFTLGAGTSFSTSVATKTTTAGIFDIAMVLIDASGYAWAGNDGTDGAVSLAAANNPGGVFYLAVTSFANDALDQWDNPIREDFWWRSVANPSGGTQFSYFSGSAFGAGDYTLSVNSVPVPAAVWLFGSGLAGLVAAGRRRRQVA